MMLKFSVALWTIYGATLRPSHSTTPVEVTTNKNEFLFQQKIHVH